MFIIDRLFWLPKKDISEEQLKQFKEDLTICRRDFKGDVSEIIESFEENEEYFGVPRQWGLKKFYTSTGLEDKTSFPTIEWPEIQIKEYWPGQLDAINKIHYDANVGLSKYGMRMEVSCGGGKTLMSLAVAQRLNTPTLILLHKEVLIEQWLETAWEFFPGIFTGIIQGQDCWYKRKHVTFGMVKTICNRDFADEVKNHFGLVIIDEGHRFPASTFAGACKKFNSRLRLSVSGTFRRKDDTECLWDWHVGDCSYKARITKLTGEYKQVIWKTFLKDDDFVPFWKKSEGSDYVWPDYSKWITAIAINKNYNLWLIDLIEKSFMAGRTTLVLSDRVAQLEYMYKHLCAKGLANKIGRFWSTSEDNKRAVRDRDILLGTYGLISEGFNVPALDTLIFATPRTDIEQSIGRIQRPKDGKKKLLIVDPVFDTLFNKTLSGARLRVYNELGFIEQGK